MPDYNQPDLPGHASVLAPSPPRQRRWFVWAAAAAVLAGLGWFAATRVPAPSPPAAPMVAAPPSLSVLMVPVRRQVLARPVIGDGSVVAWQELVIGIETGGLRVLEVTFEEGDLVRRGQVLVRLDAALPTAQATQAEAAVAESEAALRIAQSDLRRSAELVRTESGSRQLLEQREAAARQAEARLLGNRARLDEARARLAQATLLAPADGVVARRSVLPGAVVQPGQEMLRLVRDGRIELAARIPELELAAVRAGQAVRVFHGTREIEGRVRALAPVVAGDTRLGLAYVTLPDGSGLRPGMFARAEILPAATAPLLTVPQEAVVFRAGQAVVFVLPTDTDRVAARPIATGQRRDGVVEVTQGLAEGERVVAAGAGFLSDGDRVRVVAQP